MSRADERLRCPVCLAIEPPVVDGGQATVMMLALMVLGVPVTDIVLSVCPPHMRMVEIAADAGLGLERMS